MSARTRVAALRLQRRGGLLNENTVLALVMDKEKERDNDGGDDDEDDNDGYDEQWARRARSLPIIRKFLANHVAKRRRQRKSAAIVLQCSIRQYQARVRLHALLDDAYAHHLATILQQAYRSRQASKKIDEKRKLRIQALDKDAQSVYSHVRTKI